MAVATAGNDHRLGANEAPPAIISMFLGDQLEEVLEAIKEGKTSIDQTANVLETGVDSMPSIKKDSTDRNRTSPFAFTGNKFEFRSPGSSQSIAGINIVINTIVAEELSQFADRLGAAKDVDAEIMNIVRDTIKDHGRIIFNGNNYSDEWVEEAAKRGLPNLKTTVDALPVFVSDKVIKLFSSHNVFTEVECRSRYEILLEDYSKALHIEALTTLEMAKQEILPACIEYSNTVAKSLKNKKTLGVAAPQEEKLYAKITENTENLIKAIEDMEKIVDEAPADEGMELAAYYKDKVIPAMAAVREPADALELLVGKSYWPFPTYTELLYKI